MQIEKDDVGKYIANVSAQNFESQDIIDAEVSAIKAKKYADACEARFEILKLRKPPPDKSELEMQEVKAVKARAKADKMEAKWKLLTLGQPVKKKAPHARPILPQAASGASGVKPFVKNPPPPVPQVNLADAIAQKVASTMSDLKNNEVEKIVVSQAEQEAKVNQVYDALRTLEAKISEAEPAPHPPAVQPVVDGQMRGPAAAQDVKADQLLDYMQDLDLRLTVDTSLLHDKSDKLIRTVNEELAAIRQALNSGKPDGSSQKTNEELAAIKQALQRDVSEIAGIKQSIDDLQSKELDTGPLSDKLDTLIMFSAALPSSEDLIAGSQEIADIKAALQSLLARPVHIEDPAKNEELAEIRQALNELINKPDDSCGMEQAKELSDIKQAVLHLIKAQETRKDNDCLEEINQIKTILNNINGAKGDAENKRSCSFAEEDNDMKEESKDLQTDIKQVQHEISDMKSNMAALLNHNSSFYFGQLLGKLDALGQSVGSLLGGNLNVGQIMGKLDALGLAQNHPQQPVIVMPPGQPQPQQQPVIVMPPGQPQPQQQPVIVMPPGQPQPQQQPVIVMSPGQPQAQPIFFSAPQPAQPMYQQPQTTIVQQPPVSVGINNNPDSSGKAQPIPVVNNYGQPAANVQPQPAPYAQAAAPVYAQPAPSAPAPAPAAQPASAPAAQAAAPPAESPVQKMLAEMAGKLDAMKGKK